MSKCGECQMCCRIMEIETLSKPVDARCPHQCAAGCAIYDSKPQECSSYECMWLQSQSGGPLEPFPDEWRPDRIGIVMDGGGLDPIHKVVVARTTSVGESKLRSKPVVAFYRELERLGMRIMVKIGKRNPKTFQDFLAGS